MTQLYDWNKSFKEGQTVVENMQDYTLYRRNYDQRFWDSQGNLFINFLKGQQIINRAYYSNLHKD
jgi:hypothetical protein